MAYEGKIIKELQSFYQSYLRFINLDEEKAIGSIALGRSNNDV